MHVDRQGPGECCLATMAALAEVPLETVRQAACKEARVQWWMEIVGTTKFSPTILKLAHHYGGKRLQFHVAIYTDTATVGEATQKKLGTRIRKLPAKGKGTVSCFQPGHRVGHMAPWEDGLIYDPNDPNNPMTLKQFRQAHGHVKRITFEGTT